MDAREGDPQPDPLLSSLSLDMTGAFVIWGKQEQTPST
jgi:hypothetical protein